VLRTNAGSVDPGEVPLLQRGGGAAGVGRRHFPEARFFSWNAEPKAGSLLPALPEQQLELLRGGTTICGSFHVPFPASADRLPGMSWKEGSNTPEMVSGTHGSVCQPADVRSEIAATFPGSAADVSSRRAPTRPDPAR
jgi:hypothetical protein